MKNLNKLGYTKAELLVIVVLIGIVAFITINRTSYAFAYDQTRANDEIKELIESQAIDYGMDNLDLFEETDTAFIIVNDLVESGYMLANSEGNVVSPADTSKSLNDSKIKLEYDKDNNKVKATLTQ